MTSVEGRSEKPAFDRTDLDIFFALQRDGRAAVQDLARKVGVSEVTARKRLRRLQEERYMSVTAVADPFLVGVESPAIIGVKVRRSYIDEVAQKLTAYPEVNYVAAATGNAHLIVGVMMPNNSALANFLLKEITSIEGVIDTETSMILKIYKQTWLQDSEQDNQSPPNNQSPPGKSHNSIR